MNDYVVLSSILTRRCTILSDCAFPFPRSRSVYEGTTTEFDHSRSTDGGILGTENVRAIVSLDRDISSRRGLFPAGPEKALESTLTEPIGLRRLEL